MKSLLILSPATLRRGFIALLHQVDVAKTLMLSEHRLVQKPGKPMRQAYGG